MSHLYWRPGQNSAITISGARPNSNVYLLDGTVNTDPSFNTFVISPPPDAIREFQIQTGTYTAELGAGTGQINVVTKSGTLKVRGSVYEYLRNSTFDAAEFTNPDELPPFSQNQFGGTLGGPARAGIFFFAGYEGLRTTQHMSNIMFVPGTAVRTGDFSGMAPIYDPLRRARIRHSIRRCRSVLRTRRSFARSLPRTRSRRIGSTRSRAKCCNNTSCSRTSTTRPTIISIRGRRNFRTTPSICALIERGETERHCSDATASAMKLDSPRRTFQASAPFTTIACRI
jgi:hypothetical protein